MVSNYDIILKQYDLSKFEYRQIYENLVIDELVPIKFNENQLNRIINRLKYLSKSAKGLFNNCPRQFQFKRILGLNVESEVGFFNVYGKNSHMVFNKVWGKIDYDKLVWLKSRDRIRKYIYGLCRGFISNIERGTKIEDQYNYLFYNYANYESFRINHVFKDLGYDNVKRYIFPMFRELKVENHSINETGIVDIVHRLPNDEVAIGDYKAGKPKYYRWSDNPRINRSMLNDIIKDYTNYDRQAIDFELGSYYNLLMDTTDIYKVVTIGNQNRLIPLKFLNPKWGFVLYIRDWKKTYKYIKLKPAMISIINKVNENIRDAINDGIFPLNISSRCFDYCDCVDVCTKDVQWKNKFSSIHPFYKDKLDDIFLEIE